MAKCPQSGDKALTPTTLRRHGPPPHKTIQVERAETDDKTRRQVASLVTWSTAYRGINGTDGGQRSSNKSTPPSGHLLLPWLTQRVGQLNAVTVFVALLV